MISNKLYKKIEKERIHMDEATVPPYDSECYQNEVSPKIEQMDLVERMSVQYPEIDGEQEAYFNSPYIMTSIETNRSHYSENRYRAIIENSMDNIYICEARSGRIIETNESMRKLLGYSKEEMIGLRVFEFLDHPVENVEGHIQTILKKGTLKISDRRYRRKDGTLVDIEASCCVIREKDQDLLCVVSRDVSYRIEREKKLVEERNRAEFYLDILNHDIGNLHQGIMGFVKMCKYYQEDPYKTKSLIGSIDTLTMRSVHMANNLKILAKIGTDPNEIKDFEPNRLIKSCIKSVREAIPLKDPDFKIDISEKRMILADKDIEYAFYNVIQNAVKYQDTDEPVVEIFGRESRTDTIRISVSDKGCGIPISLREEVLNRDSLNKKHGGLGLSVVRSLVDRSGGSVWIKDPKEGKGTVMVIELPLA